MVPSGDMSTYLRQKPSSVIGLLLFGDLVSVGSGLCGPSEAARACGWPAGTVGVLLVVPTRLLPTLPKAPV